MRKKYIKILFNMAIFFGVLGLAQENNVGHMKDLNYVPQLKNSSLSETKDEVLSPDARCKLYTNMYNSGYTSITVCPNFFYTQAEITFRNDKIEFDCYHLLRPQRTEHTKKRMFAVLIDSGQGPIDFQFLEEYVQSGVYDYSPQSYGEGVKYDRKRYKCTLTPPYNATNLSIHIYFQNEDDPDFLLREENFLCKTRFMGADENMFYLKKTPECVSKYNNLGNCIDSPSVIKSDLYQKYTPNFYCIGGWAAGSTAFFGVLRIPEELKDEISYEDCVFPLVRYQSNIKTEMDHCMISTRVPSGSSVPIEEYYMNFNIPEKLLNYTNEIWLDIYNYGDPRECSSGEETAIDNTGRTVSKFLVQSFKITVNKG